jgi:ubiquinone/menaquinone biosynthesis C-methylase UbiE
MPGTQMKQASHPGDKQGTSPSVRSSARSDATVVASSTAAHADVGPGIPRYLEQIYWWAYVHPRAVRVFEREWLVNLILLGNYARLRNAALEEIDPAGAVRTLQVACVYGDLTKRLLARVGDHGSLDVVDVLPQQLENLRRKLPHPSRATLYCRDSTALGFPDASYDCVLLFFLLHEQPADVRRATLAEALRVTRPGGKVIVVDYHGPSTWHPLRPFLRLVLGRLEPYSLDLWRDELTQYLPAGVAPAAVYRHTCFGGLYQKVVLVR